MAILYKIIFLLFFLLLPTKVDKDSPLSQSIKYLPPSTEGHKDTLRFGVVANYGMYKKRGLPMGFQYSIMERFVEQYSYVMRIIPLDSCHWEMLDKHNVDILIIDTENDTIPDAYSEDFSMSMPIKSTTWATNIENAALSYRLNYWIGMFSHSDDYKYLEYLYFKSYNSDGISPYDGIVKECSKLIGWDWRLLSALIFQESKFRLGAYSRKGAVGLMQIKESTALHYNINHIFAPTTNILAGTLHLQFLQGRYQRLGIDSLNTVKFSLAAYNAGHGRIDQCMKYAEYLGKDPKKWESLQETIPQMRHITPQLSDSLSVKKFKGDETLSYVESVLNQYEFYRDIISPK